MLTQLVSLHDIDDAEGFVAATIQRAQLKLTPTEHEELLAEGLCILYELADKYEPHRAGYEKAGSFAGFAAQFLPRRLGDAWHRQHPEHHRINGPDGKRHWAYDPAPVSLDAAMEGPDGHTREPSVRPRDQWAPTTPRLATA